MKPVPKNTLLGSADLRSSPGRNCSAVRLRMHLSRHGFHSPMRGARVADRKQNVCLDRLAGSERASSLRQHRWALHASGVGFFGGSRDRTWAMRPWQPLLRRLLLGSRGIPGAQPAFGFGSWKARPRAPPQTDTRGRRLTDSLEDAAAFMSGSSFFIKCVAEHPEYNPGTTPSRISFACLFDRRNWP